MASSGAGASFGRAMIPRYTPNDFAELWSEKRKFETWLEVELAACEAMERAGIVPIGTAAKCDRAKSQARSGAHRRDRARRRKHDVIAFLTHVEELAGADARWLHRGMTSSDVLDTRFAILLARRRRLAARAHATSCSRRSPRAPTSTRKTPMIGRSHGIHAEPVTFGVALAGHLAEMARGRARLVAARDGDRGRQDRRRGRHLRAPLARDRGARRSARSASRPRR